MEQRFTPQHLTGWRRDGAVLIENFFSPAEITPVRADFEHLYGQRRPETASRAAHYDTGDQVGQFNFNQFRNIDDMPFDCSPALNMLGLHPALIDLAKAALETDDVRLYQSHSWAKFTGDTDYEQPFHCDYKNHTLTVPSEEAIGRTINIMIYVTDVTLETGAISYVPIGDSDPITGPDRPMFVDNDPGAQAALKASEARAPGPAGSIFAYSIDVFHRGCNLTAPEGVRYTLTASFKAAGNDMIGWSAWPFSFLKPWHIIFSHADPEQLACLGVPRPGDPFWTPRTLHRAQDRWPDWDMTAYRAAVMEEA
ncbi:MAG: phytanoyl-CoA dioxygenase family protein [Pseudomonadota bacterium]